MEPRRLLAQAAGSEVIAPGSFTSQASELEAIASDSPTPYFIAYADVAVRIPVTNAKGVPIGGAVRRGGQAVAVFDANSDGLQDVVVAYGQPYYSVITSAPDNDGRLDFRQRLTYVGKKADGKVNISSSLGLHDFDNDGLIDLYLNNSGQGTLKARYPRYLATIYRPNNIISSALHRDSEFRTQFSQGDGTFAYRDIGINGDGDPRSSVFADFDGDGNFDLFVGTAPYFGIWWSGSPAPSQFFPGLENGIFGPDSIDSIVVNDSGDLFKDEFGRGNKDFKGIVVRDFDNDGKPDILATAFSDVWDHAPKLPLNTAKPAGAQIDLDRDGMSDGGYQGAWERGILVLRNISTPGTIQFEDVSQSAIDNALGLTDQMHVHSAIPADIDHDGDLDLLVSGPRHFMAHQSVELGTDIMRVYRNDSVPGEIIFTNVTGDSGIDFMNDNDMLPWPYQGGLVVPGVMAGGADLIATPALSAGAAIDVDNDGDLDWVAVNRAWVSSFADLPRSAFYSWLFLNDGSGHFELAPRELRGLDSPARDLSYGDLNGDGRLDLVTVNSQEGSLDTNALEGTLVYLNNVENEHHFVFVRVTERANVLGIGSKVTVYEAGTSRIVGYDEVRTDFSYRSKKDAILHFGLGDVDQVDVRVQTRSGRTQTWFGIPADQTVTLDLDEDKNFVGDTVGLYDPKLFDWALHNRLNSAPTDVIHFRTGIANAIPIAGDWNHDGKDTLGLYLPATQRWILNNATDGSFDGVIYTTDQADADRSWLPIAGDWNNDGFDTVGLYNPSTNNWYLSNGIDTWEDMTTIVAPVDVPNHWQPIAGNWDGKGGDSVGLYDPSRNWWVLNNDLDGSIDNLIVFQAPAPHPAWKPVAGDWNGNGKDTVGLYVPATGRWYLNNETDGSIDDMITFRSLATPTRSLPIAGDWDGARIGVALAAESKSSVLTVEDSRAVTLPLSGESEFRNQPDTLQVDRLDVNQDGFVTPLDVLAVVNAVNRAEPTPLADLDGNGVITPADVLRLVNYVNAQQNGPFTGGEAESVPAPRTGAELPAAGLLPSGESQTQNPLVPVEQEAVLGRGQQASQRGASVSDDGLADLAGGWLDEILDELAADWLG